MKNTPINLSVILYLLIIASKASAQDVVDTSRVSYFIHIPDRGLRSYNSSIQAFNLYSIDPQKPWNSGKISPINKDSKGYLVKVDVPTHLIPYLNSMHCTAYYIKKKKPLDTLTQSYGGVELSKIRLVLKTIPQGAITYLIPHRIWETKLSKTSWQKNNDLLADFKVNTSSTNTFTHIDETVYTIVFKLGAQYKTTKFITKPESIEKIQTVTQSFQSE